MKQNKIKVLTDVEHVLLKPNMYIGGVEKIYKQMLFIDNQVELRDIEYVPGLYKIIMEIFDNSVDEAIRTNFKYANKIKVTFTDDMITIEDNGRGLPQDKFDDGEPAGVKAVCELRAGTNFSEDTKADGSIGTNGVGSALTNIFSTEFKMETCNGEQILNLVCLDNLSSKDWNIKKASKKPYTKISFKPDLKRFNLENIDKVYVNLLEQHMTHLVQVFPKIEFTLIDFLSKDEEVINSEELKEVQDIKDLF